MNARTTFFLVATLLGAAVMIVGLNARRMRSIEEGRIEIAAKQRASLEANIRRVEVRIAVAERELQTTRTALAALGKETLDGPVAPAANASGPGAMVNADTVRDNPKLQALLLRSARANLAQRYGPLFRSLGLTQVQTEKFGELTMKRHEQLLDLETAARNARNEDAAAIAELRKRAEDGFATAQKELLGESRYRQLQEYERTWQPRDLVAKLAGATSLNGIPLTIVQAEQLSQVIADSSARYRRGESARVAEVDWATVDLRAAEILSPEQLLHFKTIEPIGGGISRWTTDFDRALDAARKASRTASPTNPSGG